MAKLTDKQRKRIIADRVNGMSFRKLAEKYHVSVRTIQRVLNNNEEVVQKATQKKEQNTLDMLSFMDQRKGIAQDLIENIIVALNNPEKLSRANVRDLATALGIIVDKFTQNASQATQGNNLLQEIRDGINEGKHYVE